MSHTEEFAQSRPLLFTVAYEILGSAADAEDVLHDSYLRWRDVDLDTVTNPKAYLVQTVTRQALNHLRTGRRRRETYLGSWLPEPIRTAPDVSEDAVLAESVSVALLLVLETLSPDERVVFVLHEVFDYTYGEIAQMVDKNEPTVRQSAHRARAHVHARRRRFRAEPSTTDEVVGSFLRAAAVGDIQSLMDVLAPDVVQIADGGGKVSAGRRPVAGRENVARLVLGLANREYRDYAVSFANYNGLPSVLFHSGDQLRAIMMLEVGEDRLVHRIYAVVNPDKLSAAEQLRPLDLGTESPW